MEDLVRAKAMAGHAEAPALRLAGLRDGDQMGGR